MRIGLVGAGFIGRTHLRAAEAVEGLEVVGMVDPLANRDHPGLVGQRFFDSVGALAREAKPDGVIVAVPDEFHVPVAKEALSLGLAVLLEKPAARSLEECFELAAAAPDARSRVLVGHQRRHHPAARIAKELVEGGALGTLIGVSGLFALRKDDNYFVERPRGVVLTNLVHDFDLLQYFCGRLEAVNAVASHIGRHAREEDTLAVTMEFSTGAVGTMLATDASPSPWGWDQSTKELPSIPYTPAGTTYSLLGRDASLTVPDLRMYRHNAGEAWHHPLAETQVSVPEGNAYVNQLKHFLEVMGGSVRPIVSVDEAIATQAGLEAVFISARENRRVTTEELTGKHLERA